MSENQRIQILNAGGTEEDIREIEAGNLEIDWDAI